MMRTREEVEKELRRLEEKFNNPVERAKADEPLRQLLLRGSLEVREELRRSREAPLRVFRAA